MDTNFNLINWIIVLIFVGGLVRLFFGSNGESSQQDEHDGSGYFTNREEAERHGKYVNTSGHPHHDDGPGFYD